MKNIFVQGAIDLSFIAESIARHKTKINIGGHSIFLGQVRADSIEGKAVVMVCSDSFSKKLKQDTAGLKVAEKL